MAITLRVQRKMGFVLVFFMLLQVQAQEAFLIENVRLFDGEKFIDKTSVLVKDGIIEAVGIKDSRDIKVIDGLGKTLVPAFTNSHVHVWAAFSLSEAAKAGVLNVFDMHSLEAMQPALKKYKDSTNFASLYTAGAAATAPEGHGTQFGFPSPTLSSPEEAEAFIAERVKSGANYIKIIVEPWKATLNEATIQALINASHAKNRIAVVHISKLKDAKFVLNNKANGLVHIWWDKQIDSDDLNALAKLNDIFVIPTLLTSTKALAQMRPNAAEGQFLSDAQLKQEVKKLFDAGVHILAGTDPPNVQINYGTDLYKEMNLLLEAGLPMIDVLKSTTSLPALHFGLKNKGSIKAGFVADMILIDGILKDDLEVLNNAKTIFKNGIPLKK